ELHEGNTGEVSNSLRARAPSMLMVDLSWNCGGVERIREDGSGVEALTTSKALRFSGLASRLTLGRACVSNASHWGSSVHSKERSGAGGGLSQASPEKPRKCGRANNVGSFSANSSEEPGPANARVGAGAGFRTGGFA